MHRRLWLAASAALLAACVGAPPKPEARLKTTHRENFYDVSGGSAEELYAQMMAHGLRKSKRVLFGEYRWDVTWDYRFGSSWSGGTCYMTEVTVRLETQATLPRWQPPSSADPALVQQWARFTGALKTHQKGHADLALRTAEDIRRNLRNHTAGNCDAMKAAADRLAANLLAHHRQVDEQYDVDTRYGVSQQAIWPPTASH